MEQEILTALSADNAETRRAAIARAAESPTHAVLSRLAELIENPDESEPLRQAAAEALGRMPGSAGGETLLRLLESSDPHRRTLAAIGLVPSRRPEAIVPLIQALRDPVNTVRNAAERALIEQIELVRTHGVESLLELLADPVPLTRSPAARLIGLTRDPRGLAPLLEIARTDRQWLARLWAAKALGDLGCAEAADTLHDRLDRDEKNRVRAAAAEAIGRLRPPKGEAWLLHALEHDDDGGVRKLAAEALRLYGIDVQEPDQDDLLDDLSSE
jgi:HEAT repeat protein